MEFLIILFVSFLVACLVRVIEKIRLPNQNRKKEIEQLVDTDCSPNYKELLKEARFLLEQGKRQFAPTTTNSHLDEFLKRTEFLNEP